jgi:hypothetical protein
LAESARFGEDFRGRVGDVPRLAARIPDRLYKRLLKLDDESVPIAETYRRVAAEAERLGLMRPSYERIRVLVHQSRRWRRSQGPSTASVVVDVSFRLRPPEAILDQLSGIGVPTRR